MKKTIVFLFLAFICLFLYSSPVLAETETVQLERRYDLPSAADLNESKAACKDGICADNMMNFQLNALAGAATCTLGGLICGAETPEEQTGYIKRSVLGQTGQAMAYLFDQPPATTTEYLAWMGGRVGLIPKTYAQGVTFSRLLPILPIWKAFRDIAFMLLAIIMLLIGLMIMFRAKVNPQTVANVENTIPRVVMSIILIWLSFPIAALIIDFMYLLIAAGIGVIGNAVGDPNLPQAIQDYSTGGFTTLFAKTLAPIAEFNKLGGAGGYLSKTTAVSGILLLLPGIGWIFSAVVALVGVIGGFAITTIETGGDVGAGILSAVSPILVFVVLIVLFFQVFKIFFLLLSAYTQILISIILGPIYLLFNAVPGRNTFTTWWKGIVANMLAFVITANMLYLAWAIASVIDQKSFWTAPFLIQGSGVSQAVICLIALGIVLLIPQVIALVKQAMGVKSIFQVGPAMVLGPVTGAISQGAQIGGQFNQASMGWEFFQKKILKKP